MERPFDIYFNLHQRLYSVVDRRTGRVIDHITQFTADDTSLVVQRAGNARVRQTLKKNVHAFIRCAGYTTDAPDMSRAGRAITYNPYRDREFVYCDDHKAAAKPTQVIGTLRSDRTPSMFQVSVKLKVQMELPL